VKLTFKDTTDLDGYDAWGRIDWMRHYKVSDSSDIAKFSYGYDYASNRTYQEDLVNASMDELYGYDTLHRLTSFKRGDLNANKNGITGAPAREQARQPASVPSTWTGAREASKSGSITLGTAPGSRGGSSSRAAHT